MQEVIGALDFLLKLLYCCYHLSLCRHRPGPFWKRRARLGHLGNWPRRARQSIEALESPGDGTASENLKKQRPCGRRAALRTRNNAHNVGSAFRGRSAVVLARSQLGPRAGYDKKLIFRPPRFSVRTLPSVLNRFMTPHSKLADHPPLGLGDLSSRSSRSVVPGDDIGRVEPADIAVLPVADHKSDTPGRSPPIRRVIRERSGSVGRNIGSRPGIQWRRGPTEVVGSNATC